MKKILCSLFLFLSLPTFSASDTSDCKAWPPLLKLLCQRVKETWREGQNELYLSGYAWHNRYTYGKERLKMRQYNEHAWGGGIGKGFFNARGNWDGLYAFAFLDSHKNVEPVVGYAHLWVASLQELKAGLGYSLLITARPDIFHNIPFPGAVPWAGIFFKQISLKAAYIPGLSNNGNVLYMVATYSFDKK